MQECLRRYKIYVVIFSVYKWSGFLKFSLECFTKEVYSVGCDMVLFLAAALQSSCTVKEADQGIRDDEMFWLWKEQLQSLIFGRIVCLYLEIWSIILPGISSPKTYPPQYNFRILKPLTSLING